MDVELGLWVPCIDTGYGAHTRPWVLERRNIKCWGGTEILQTAAYRKRRFATCAAAQKIADELNGSNNKGEQIDALAPACSNAEFGAGPERN